MEVNKLRELWWKIMDVKETDDLFTIQNLFVIVRDLTFLVAFVIAGYYVFYAFIIVLRFLDKIF